MQTMEKEAVSAAFDESFLPLILKEKKETLEADGWQFDYDTEKQQWRGVKPGAVGGTGFNSLAKLIGYIERRLAEDKEKTAARETEIAAMINALTNAPFPDMIPADSFFNPLLVITDLPKDEKKFEKKVRAELLKYEQSLAGDIVRYEELCRSKVEEKDVSGSHAWNSPFVNLELKISHIYNHKKYINACLMLLGEPTRYPGGKMPDCDLETGTWEIYDFENEPRGETENSAGVFEPQTRIVEWSFLQEIAATNSCQSISEKCTIKEPFEFENGLYIATSSTSSGRTEYTGAQAYRVLTEDEFKEILVNVEKIPGTFYHGEKVKHKKDEYILALPKLKFVLSFDFHALFDLGWEIERRPDGDWQAEKTFDSGVVSLIEGKTPEHLASLIADEEKNFAALGESDGISHLEPPFESDTDENEISDSVESETPLPMFAVESCRFDLSDEEILQRTYSMRHAQAELLGEDARFAREKDIHKSNVKMINARVEMFGHAIDTKSEYRELECSLEYDFQKEAVITRRPDTGEIISRRGMTKEERQKRLFS